MRPLAKTEDLLEEMRSKPALFLGTTSQPFTALVAFLSGYTLAVSRYPATQAQIDLVPPDFAKFVGLTLGLPLSGTKHWSDYIRQKAASEEEAFQMFFQIRTKYRWTLPAQ